MTTLETGAIGGLIAFGTAWGSQLAANSIRNWLHPLSRLEKVSTEGLRPAHNPHVYGVRRGENGEAIVEQTFTGAMLEHANHDGVGAYLNRGPDYGVQWHGGAGNVEWGTFREEPKTDPGK